MLFVKLFFFFTNTSAASSTKVVGGLNSCKLSDFVGLISFFCNILFSFRKVLWTCCYLPATEYEGSVGGACGVRRVLHILKDPRHASYTASNPQTVLGLDAVVADGRADAAFYQ